MSFLVALRSKTGISFCQSPPSDSSRKLTVSTRDAVMALSGDGKLFACVGDEGVIVYSLPEAGADLPDSLERVALLSSVKDARLLAFSPNGSFIITAERWTKASTEDNIKVFHVKETDDDGHPRRVFSMSNKVVKKDNWPLLHWTKDEKWMMRMVTNEVVLHCGDDPTKVSHRLRVDNVGSFSFAPCPSPSGTHYLSVFIPPSKGGAAHISVLEMPKEVNRGETQFVKQPVASATTSTFKAQDAEMIWNSLGSAVLVKTQTDVDSTGKTYYGESNVTFLRADGSFKSLIDTAVEGPVHAVAWSPNGKEFITIAGLMPAKATMYNSLCQAKFDFGRNHRNTIRFNPSGKLLCLGGFGNLTGNMDFYEKKGGSFEMIATAQAQCAVTAEFCPDGRTFLTSVCAPRMRVDNGFKFWKYNGQELYSEDVQELYETVAQACAIAEKPLSPRDSKPLEAQQAAQPKAYRPPNSSGSLAAMLRKEREDSGPRKITPRERARNDGAAYGLPVGADPEEYRKQMKKKERERKRKEKKAQEKKEAEAQAQPTPAPAADGVVDYEKKAKGLRKKLRQIDQLKQQVADGKTLDAGQQDKLKQEDTLKEQLAEFEKKAAESK